MERCSVTAIRNPFEPGFTHRVMHAGVKRYLQISLLNSLRPRFQRHPQIAEGRIVTTDGTVGVSATGNLNQETLKQILTALPTEGIFELVCHPGYNDHDLERIATRLRAHREVEQEALHAVIPAVLSQPNAPTLIHFGSLQTAHAQELS
jgi:hypothetical protein